jgi:RimJ/RimL family protein N-acetyltransferase
MFPDLTCDDIFQIETQRLWLRWPRSSDATAITAFASLAEVAQLTAAIPHPYPKGEAERFILKARAENAGGAALNLAITQKSGARRVIGLISATLEGPAALELGYILAPPMWGKGFATEAIKAVVDMLFRVTMANRLTANSRVQNTASRRALEKAGFAFVDARLDFLPARGGMHACDRFQLDRKTWAAIRVAAGVSQAMPAMAQQSIAESEEKSFSSALGPSDI